MAQLPEPGYCVHCSQPAETWDVIDCNHRAYTPADRAEQLAVMEKLNTHDDIPYRGFSLYLYVNGNWGADIYDGYTITGPSIPALLHIIWLITKD